MNRAEILAAADAAINGQRNVQYGTPENNFERIAILWTAYFQAKHGRDFPLEITAEDVSWLLGDVKEARSMHAYHSDNYIDAAGYAACGGEIAARRAQS